MRASKTKITTSKTALPRTRKAKTTVSNRHVNADADAETVASAGKADTFASVLGPTVPTLTRPKPDTKIGIVLGLLEQSDGVSLAHLVEVTGWLPHTTRAALTGLRKRGFTVASMKVEGAKASTYRIIQAAA